MDLFYNRAGQPIGHDEWAKLYEDKRNRRVAVSDYPQHSTRVSTVWVGIDVTGERPPLIYESMVFGGTHDNLRLQWPTEQMARDGHTLLCEHVLTCKETHE